LSTMFWTGILVMTIVMVFAMAFCFVLDEDLKNEEIALASRHELYELFGTFDRSMLAVHELTFGNWIPITKFLSMHFSRYYGFFFMGYRCIISFGILLVIRSVFVAETIRCAQTDDEIMILQKDRQVRVNSERMVRFFAEADDSGDGYVSLQEFREILANKRVQTWLSAQDLQINDPAFVFELVDTDGTDCLSAVELAHGLSVLKGPAKSMDMIGAVVKIRKMEKKINDMYEHLMPDKKKARAEEKMRLEVNEFNADFNEDLQYASHPESAGQDDHSHAHGHGHGHGAGKQPHSHLHHMNSLF